MTLVREKFAGKNASRDEHVTPPCGFSSTKPKTEPKPSLVMKPIIPFALLGALFAVGAANAASTTPVGYETLSLQSGFNYLGLRLHAATVSAGTFETVTANQVTDTGSDLGALLDDNTTYVLEINNGSGVVQEFLGSAATGDSISLVSDITGSVSAGASYQIRPAATLASVFGANNSAGLATGFFGPGGDIVFVPDGAGGFAQYYYDEGESSWADSNGVVVDGASVPLVYLDGVVIAATGDLSLTVTGEVKKTSTSQLLLSESFNYLGSVYPAGATLASSFDAAIPTLDKGFFGPGGDTFFVPDGAGGFNQYYYDDGESSWADATSGTVIDATQVDLPAGVLVFNTGAAAPLLNSAPASYSSL